MPSNFLGPSITRVLVEQDLPDYTGVNYHTSAQSVVIPIMWGTRRLSPNLIWQSPTTTGASGGGTNTKALASAFGTPDYGDDDHTFHGNIKLGGLSGVDQGTRWWSPTITALCEGPIIDPSTLTTTRVWRGGGSPAISWLDNFAQGLEIGVTIFTGTT